MLRIITAVILGALAIAVIWWLPGRLFNLLVVAIAALGLFEFSRIFIRDGVMRWATTLSGLALSAAMLFCPLSPESIVILLAALLFLMALLFMWRATDLTGIAEQLGLSILGIVYLGLAFPFWGWLRGLYWGRELVLLTLAPACLCDTFAFFAGKLFGKRRMSPLVSPNKTVEGFVGALVGSLVGTFLVRWLVLPQIAWQFALGLALVIWIISPMGDLIESMLKRSAGVKDSGSIIPGHGGVLDRLDALIFSGPAAYVFVKYVIGI
ncbi:MAG: phosphatidate cytidylyltransferase [Pseudomonadota bacterium]